MDERIRDLAVEFGEGGDQELDDFIALYDQFIENERIAFRHALTDIVKSPDKAWTIYNEQGDLMVGGDSKASAKIFLKAMDYWDSRNSV